MSSMGLDYSGSDKVHKRFTENLSVEHVRQVAELQVVGAFQFIIENEKW